MKVLLFLYEVFLRGLYSLGTLGIFFSGKWKRAVETRRGLMNRMRELSWPSNPIWFHVSSAGEFEQCIILLDELKRRNPKELIFISFFSPSAEKAIERERKRRQLASENIPWDAADYLPWDFSGPIKMYLQLLKPKCLFLVHREWWPNLMFHCRSSNIPISLLAAQCRGNLLDSVPLRLLQTNSSVFTEDLVSCEIAQRYGMRAKVVGDPRIDRIFFRSTLSSPSWVNSLGKNLVVFASTERSEADAVKRALLKVKGSPFRAVVVAHEVHRKSLRRWEDWFQRQQMPVQLFSEWLREPSQNHLLVDQVGVLFDLYRASQVVFVGGSFDGKVHNVAEPAVFSNAILTGPCIRNSKAAQVVHALGGIIQCTPKDLADELSILLSDQNRRVELGRCAFDALQTMRGSSEQLVLEIEKLIPRKLSSGKSKRETPYSAQAIYDT